MKIVSATTIVFLVIFSAFASFSQGLQSSDYAKSNELNAESVKLYNAGQYDQALTLAKQALDLRVKAVGQSHEELVPILKNLGEITKWIKAWDDSASYFNRALQIAESAFGPNDLRTAAILERLAFVEHERKRDSDAVNLFERALKLKKSALKAEDPEIAETAYNLGQLYGSRAEYKKAERLYQLAITIWENGGNATRWKLTKALESYILIETALGKKDEATKSQHQLGGLSNQQAILDGGVLNGKALVLVTPGYPMLPPGYPHPSGEVHVQVLIDENGLVLTAKTIKSRLSIEFNRAAENAARQSRFSPTFKEGKPIKVNGTIIYNFVTRH